MTIKGLSAFITKTFPSARRRVPIEFFQNQHIAMDAYLLSYAYMSTSIGKEAKNLLHARKIELNSKKITSNWLGRWVQIITLFKESSLIPVVVFDGPDVPPEKVATRADREEDRKKIRDRIAALKQIVDQEDLEPNMEAREELIKLFPRDISISKEQFASLRMLLELAGISMIQAPGEGEAMCASLVKSGQCQAVYTQDSDMGAYLSPRVIKEIERPTYTVDGQRIQVCEVIYYYQVMNVLHLSEEQFIDFCIMCGTDYNKNVPKFGPAKSYKLLTTYGSLDAIPTEKYSKNLLNYERIREIFLTPAVAKSGDISSPPIPQTHELTQLLASHGLLRIGGQLLSLLGRPFAANPAVTDQYEEEILL